MHDDMQSPKLYFTPQRKSRCLYILRVRAGHIANAVTVLAASCTGVTVSLHISELPHQETCSTQTAVVASFPTATTNR